MKSILAIMALSLGLAHFQAADKQNDGRIALPNPKLLTCRSSDCSFLWSEKTEQSTVFPKQVSFDMNQNCIYGITALYDKSVSFDAIKSAIDEQYAKWAKVEYPGSTLKAWRVEPERFGIQLSVATKSDQKRNIADEGTKQVIYIAFGGRSACGPSSN
jgi:hypothetical protein